MENVAERRPRLSRREILNSFIGQMGNPEVDMVDDSREEYARHICLGGNKVFLLPRQVCPFSTPIGVVNIVYYRCNECGKLIIDKNFM